MLKKIILAMAVVVAFSGAIQAHKYHAKHDREHTHVVKAWGATWGENGMVAEAERYNGGNPTGWRRSWCGEFMLMVAEHLGLHAPKGAALAANWQYFGYAAAPGTVGSVMVMPHHVALVKANLGNGTVLTVSGNHGHRVGEGVYPIRRAIAWRLAG